MKRITPKVSIIISTHSEPTHLWSTICSFKESISFLNDTVEIIIGDNNPTKKNECQDYFKGLIWVPVDIASTSIVRNRAASSATGEILCFSDTHVVVPHDLLKRAVDLFDSERDLGLLHTHTVFWGGDGFYSYKLDLEESFVGSNCNKCTNPSRAPYYIPASGHGLFFIRRGLFEKIGGYLDTQIGWGGEEIFLDLLVWLYGWYVMVDPMSKHWHLPGEFVRPYRRNGMLYTANNIQAAYVIGGDTYLKKVTEYYKYMENEAIDVDNIMARVPVLTNARRMKVLQEAKYSLEDLIKMWDDIGLEWKDK